MAKQDPRKLVIAKLASSGLVGEDALELGYEILDAKTVAKLFPKTTTCDAPGLKLTYYDVNGKELPTYRVRLLGELKGAFGEAVKLRYLQPAGTPPAAYLPPTVKWKSVMADPEAILLITEGELKAACATKHGFPCIGLGGVSSWRSAKRGMGFLPELEQFVWAKREVFICFDSDSATNPDVAAATSALVKVLSDRGAVPRVVKIPDVEGLEKTGLDDLLVKGGTEALKEALAAAPNDELALKLWEFNQRFTFVDDPGAVYDVCEVGDKLRGRLIDPSKFRTATMANVWASQSFVGSDGASRMKRVQVADEWVKWPLRAHVHALTYEPGEPRFTGGCLNAWTGWGCEPGPGDVKLWKGLLDHLFDGADPEARQWFESWCLYPLRYPGAKLQTAAGLWSRSQGLGKSLIGKLLGRIYGPSNYSEVSQRELESTFNGWQVNKQLVMFDDVTAYDNKAKAGVLKKMITADTVLVNIKGIPTYHLPDKSNFYMTSNKANAFHVEDEDRRFFIHEILSRKLDPEFFKRFYAWMGGTRSQPELGPGPGALLRYAIEDHDFGTFEPHAPAPMTQAKADMIDTSKNEAELWVAELAREPESKLRLGEMVFERDLFTASELLSMFDPTRKGLPVSVNTFGLRLRDFFNAVNGGATLKPGDVSERFYAVRNCERWLEAKSPDLLKHIREHRAKERGGKKGKF